MDMTLKEIASACGGEYFGSADMLSKRVTGACIDSRKADKGCIFIPLKGARSDGHDFIGEAMKKGALSTLSERELYGAAFPYILVKSCGRAMRDIAEYYLKSLDVKVIGVTGSVGKTSTKELIASVCSQRYKVLKTEGNFNSQIGLPLTVFRINKEHEVAVLEMGISMPGEMSNLARIARPDICVITNIAPCHLENLRDLDGVLREKAVMFDYMKKEGSVILNGDDMKLRSVRKVGEKPVYFYGTSPENDAYVTDIFTEPLRGVKCEMHVAKSEFEVTVSAPGRHMALNALCAAAVGKKLSLTDDEIKRGIESYSSVEGRNSVISTGFLRIIDDCYNANPVSVRAGLDVLAEADTRKVAVLGDMFELGSESCRLHYECGRYAADKGIDVIVCVGELSENTALGAKSGAQKGAKPEVLSYGTKEEFLKDSRNVLRRGDTVLIKASHGMDFGSIVSALRGM